VPHPWCSSFKYYVPGITEYDDEPLSWLGHAFQFANLPFDKNADPFSAVIRCTSERDIDNKTISKWARALRYASGRKEPHMRLKTFMKEAGGVNACAAAYAKTYAQQ
jgi:hypothetical protein